MEDWQAPSFARTPHDGRRPHEEGEGAADGALVDGNLQVS